MNCGGRGAPENNAPVSVLEKFIQNTKKYAFTMAEVLITLGIIGIVAALTIPNLTRKWEERAIISKYKKMYSTLANAYNRAVADNGSPEYWDLSDKASILKILEPYLNVTERCYNKKGCVSDGNFKSLSGAERYHRLSQNVTYPKIRLNGGFSLVVVAVHQGCEYDTTVVDSSGNTVPVHMSNECGAIIGVVTNKKGKDYINYYGKDHFSFVVTQKGIYPYGYNFSDSSIKEYCKKGTIEANTSGATCGTWILRYDNTDYLY